MLALALLFPAGGWLPGARAQEAAAAAAAATPTPRPKRPATRRTEPPAAAATSPAASSPSQSGAAVAPARGRPQRGAARSPAAATPAPTPAAPITRFRVTADTTPFYKLGPQQPAGPDLALKKDTRVTMVKRSFGYSQIKLDDGMVGYVGNEDLKILTPEEVANETTLTLTNSMGGGPAGSAALFGGAVGPNATARRRGPRMPALPLPPGAQEPSLPLPDFAPMGPTPKPQPTPAFRLNPE